MRVSGGVREAIVLRSFLPKRGKLILFDKLHGKVVVSVRLHPPQHVIQGSLVHYSICSQRLHVPFARSLDMIVLPASKMQHNINFLHYVLEILNITVQESDSAHDVFMHCGALFDDVLIAMFPYTMFCQLFVVRLFALVGIYPEEHIAEKYPFIRRLILSPLTTMVRYIPSVDSEVLSVWIKSCTRVHLYERKSATELWRM